MKRVVEMLVAGTKMADAVVDEDEATGVQRWEWAPKLHARYVVLCAPIPPWLTIPDGGGTRLVALIVPHGSAYPMRGDMGGGILHSNYVREKFMPWIGKRTWDGAPGNEDVSFVTMLVARILDRTPAGVNLDWIESAVGNPAPPLP